MTLTHARLTELLHYEPDTGNFYWLKSRGTAKVGNIAGSLCNGYIRVSIGGESHYAHRLAWIYTHGFVPDTDIDHIDGNTSNNRMTNLRLATRSQNNANSPKSLGRSGVRGAIWHKASGRWRSAIRVNGRIISLGYFSSPEDAAAAYTVACRKYFKEFAR